MDILYQSINECKFHEHPAWKDVSLINTSFKKCYSIKYDGVNNLKFYLEPIQNSTSEIFNPRKKKCILDIGIMSNLQLILNKKGTKVDMHKQISFKKLGQNFLSKQESSRKLLVSWDTDDTSLVFLLWYQW